MGTIYYERLKLKGAIMRIIRFLLFLSILFIICFWLGGGHTIINTPAESLSTIVQDKLPSTESLSEKQTTLLDTWERSTRIINLPSAVNKKINKIDHYVTIDNIGLPLQQAIIAVEDNRFYSHSGFDIEAILRASLVNLQFGQIEEGASTITQQLIKNLFLTQEQTLGRKAEEFILAVDLEARYPKDKILELYLNTIYFGSGFYGIHDAALGYFGKRPDELTLAEATMLAGLPNAPSIYSPYVDFQAAKYRQAIVLETMQKAGYINQTILENAKNEKIWLVQ